MCLQTQGSSAYQRSFREGDEFSGEEKERRGDSARTREPSCENASE
jgi:hypothetical protein